MGLFSPVWKGEVNLKLFLGNLFSSSENRVLSNGFSLREEKERLLVENEVLQQRVSELQELLALDQMIDSRLEMTPARVIFRSPSSWNRFLWVNVGEAYNRLQGREWIAKNSPVLSGSSIVGVIDQVEETRSRVRLITDPDLRPSVRVARGGFQDELMKNYLDSLIRWTAARDSLKKETHSLLDLKEKFRLSSDHHLLAKGELCGSCQTQWRSSTLLLKGTGFNYDFADEEGPARDLRSGVPIEEGKGLPALPILQKGDLLVTTGMDGVFPPQLPIAEVIKVESLQEGDYFYELWAIPTAGNLNDLSFLFILPPLDF